MLFHRLLTGRPQTTHFVGFDVARGQPDPQWLDEDIPDAARRIRWTHGNMCVCGDWYFPIYR